MMQSSRPGTALVVALALLALGSALLAGASAAARSATRGQVTLEALLAAESEARVVLAERVAAWTPADDSLPLNVADIRGVGPRPRGFGGVEVRSIVRVQRLVGMRWVIAVSTRAGPDSTPRARRRLSLVVERRVAADSARTLLPLAPLGRWGTADLF